MSGGAADEPSVRATEAPSLHDDGHRLCELDWGVVFRCRAAFPALRRIWDEAIVVGMDPGSWPVLCHEAFGDPLCVRDAAECKEAERAALVDLLEYSPRQLLRHVDGDAIRALCGDIHRLRALAELQMRENGASGNLDATRSLSTADFCLSLGDQLRDDTGDQGPETLRVLAE